MRRECVLVRELQAGRIVASVSDAFIFVGLKCFESSWIGIYEGGKPAFLGAQLSPKRPSRGLRFERIPEWRLSG